MKYIIIAISVLYLVALGIEHGAAQWQKAVFIPPPNLVARGYVLETQACMNYKRAQQKEYGKLVYECGTI